MAYNFLIVDDSSVMRKMLARTVRMCGLEVGEIYEAGNGQEGLDALAARKVDLIFVDINMPVMNGEEMVDRVRADPKTEKLPVVFISSESSSSRIEILMQKKAGFVHKPFSPEALRENIVSALGACGAA